MKKLTYLLFLAMGVTACSVESLDSTENLLTADAKYKITEAKDPMGFYAGPNLKGTLSVWNDCDNLYVQIVPSRDAPEDAELGVFSSLPTLNNGGNLENNLEFDLNDATNLKWTISLSTLDTEKDLIVFVKAWGDWAGILDHGKQEYSIFEFDFSACICEERFSYDLNENGSYTFSYIPAEDITNAFIEFTFAQGVATSGYNWSNWNGNSSTRSENMDLEACNVYTWTIQISPNCSGNSNNSNVWTDFKVNDQSKKMGLNNIVKGC